MKRVFLSSIVFVLTFCSIGNAQATSAPVIPSTLAAELYHWSVRTAETVGRTARPLDKSAWSYAQRAGVQHPENIRVRLVREIPHPNASTLKKMDIDAKDLQG